ncbi:unnamed protein product [Orchesella dallaii]|uniref:Uncharacterized protein n=1 Tax=Orchesella dallaii TaxID=48710 RepID=A0ABP1RP33_9HEXA
MLLTIFIDLIRRSLQFGLVILSVIGTLLPLTAWNGFLPLIHLPSIHVIEDARNTTGIGVMIRTGVFALTWILKEGFMDAMNICKAIGLIMSSFCVNIGLVRIKRYLEKVTEPSEKGLENIFSLQKQV